MSQLQRKILFPTAVYFKDIPNAKELNKYLFKEIKKWRKADPKGEAKTNSGFGWHSKTDMDRRKEYKPLIDELFNNTNSKIIGFEPSEEEFNKLEKNNPRKIFYDYAIGDGSEKYLNICKGPGMTSFLEPDLDYLNNFHWFGDFAEIIKKQK